jgi:hypothetical protein
MVQSNNFLKTCFHTQKIVFLELTPIGSFFYPKMLLAKGKGGGCRYSKKYLTLPKCSFLRPNETPKPLFWGNFGEKL